MTATFQNYCTCGGNAWQMNGRPESQPHMDWCPQAKEYAEWFATRPTHSPPATAPTPQTPATPAPVSRTRPAS